jgi:hypothetical protein
VRDLDVAQQRLRNQKLIGPQPARPEDVVKWMGAVQSQDYPGAKWALGQRTRGATDAAIDEAFAEGRILRTHVMRPTWHFVVPADIRWMLALTAPRVNATMAYYYRQLEVDDALFARSNAVFKKVLRGGKQLIRAELGKALENAGITATGVRLGFLLIHAELDAVICSGALRGKQHTWALLDERVPETRALTRDEALAELTRRYFASHGPAQLGDFVWWSGLTMADAKKGVGLEKPDLTSQEIGAKTYWFSVSMKAAGPEAGTRIHLLPNYDEYFIAFKDRSAVADAELFKKPLDVIRYLYGYIVVLNGRVIGGWKRRIEKDRAIIEVRLPLSLDKNGKQALKAASERYGAFIGQPVEVDVVLPSRRKGGTSSVSKGPGAPENLSA